MDSKISKKPQKRAYYSPEYKIYAIIYMREHFLSFKQTARKLLPNQTKPGGKTIRSWVRQYKEKGPMSFFNNEREKQETTFRKPIDLKQLENKSQKELIEIIKELDCELCVNTAFLALEKKKTKIENDIKVFVVNSYKESFTKTMLFNYTHIPNSTFYDNDKPKEEKPQDPIDEKIRFALHDIRERRKIYRGCKALVAILFEDYGIKTYKEKVYKIAKEEGLLITKKESRRKNKSLTKDRMPACERLIKTGFRANEPLRYFCTDVIKLEYSFGIIKVSCVMDYYSRMIVCYHTSFHENSDLANETLNLLEKALPFKVNDGIFHSDRAGIYRTYGFHNYLEKLSLKQSHSRPYKSTDNPFIEQFYHVLRDEFYNQRQFETLEEFNKGIEEWMHYYNYERKYTNTNMSPSQMYSKYYEGTEMEIPEINFCFSHNNDKEPKRFRY